MRFDFDSRHDAFHVTAVIQQRRKTRPALLAHAVAFIKDDDTAGNHRAHQRRCHVAQFALRLQ